MNMRRVLLCGTVAVSLGALFTTCTGRDDRDSTAAKQSLPPGREVGHSRSPDELVGEQIRTRIEVAGVTAELRAGGEPVYASDALPGFYVRRLYRPAWEDKHGPTRSVYDLVNALRRADLEGLRPEEYHLAAIETLLAAVRADVRSGGLIYPDRWAELDLLLTDAFLVYGSHLLAGRVNPETLMPEWVANRRGADLAAVLETALASGDVAGTLATLAPPQRGFRQLREALVYHRAVAARGGWPTIPSGATLKRGDYGPTVAALNERLRLGGDLGAAVLKDARSFDETLEQALMRFQRRHGLTATGAMDEATRAELNVSAERRVEQLELNLERWRWLPQDLGRRHIIVNIAAFELEVVEEEAVVLAMRVVVGLPFHHTPVFSETMRYLVLNPYWYVPDSIAVQEMLPRIQHDLSYLAPQKMRVFLGRGMEALEVDPATVEWSKINPDDFPYRLIQDPGPVNALGRIKFMFPNKFNVYLHDTPARPLFDETQRDFSHGCIRIQKPIELAEYLLQKDPRWNRDALLRTLDEAVDLTVPLPEPMPVHILYWTAWADEDHTIQFRRDIYDQDAPLLEAMRAPSPKKV
jgi:murein L,D-transpeptidase YcbB/YkuD